MPPARCGSWATTSCLCPARLLRGVTRHQAASWASASTRPGMPAWSPRSRSGPRQRGRDGRRRMLTGSRTAAGASCAPGASTGAPTGGKQVGQEGGSCTLVDLQQGSVNCAGTAELRKGQISFQALTTAEATKELVVAGGTGAY